MTLDNPTSLLTTSDIGSHLEGHRGLLKTLDQASRRALVVDAGGFFGDTGFNRLGQGTVERSILTGFYDLCLPSGSAFAQYLSDPELFDKSVCTNVTRRDGAPVFHRFRQVRVAGTDTLVLGILGKDAFDAVPDSDRNNLHWHEPARCVRVIAEAFARRIKPAQRTEPPRRSAIIVVSSSGLDADHDLAGVCPQISVIVSGSDHIEEHSSNRVGNVTVVTAAGRGAGYAVIKPALAAWDATTMAFPADSPGRPRESLRPFHTRIDELAATLAEPVGTVHPRYRDTTPNAGRLLTFIASDLVRSAGCHQAVFAESSVRAVPLGKTLTRGELIKFTDRDPLIVVVEIDIASAKRLPMDLVGGLGHLVAIGPLPRQGTARIVTSAAIAAQLPDASVVAELHTLGEHILRVLTAPEKVAESAVLAPVPVDVLAAAD